MSFFGYEFLESLRQTFHPHMNEYAMAYEQSQAKEYLTGWLRLRPGSKTYRLVSNGCYFAYIGAIKGICRGLLVGTGLALRRPLSYFADTRMSQNGSILYYRDLFNPQFSYADFNGEMSSAKLYADMVPIFFGLGVGVIIGGTVGMVQGVFKTMFDHGKKHDPLV